MPPIRLNFKDTASNTLNMPKYIGFLDIIKIPDVTSEVAFSIFIGFTVV